MTPGMPGQNATPPQEDEAPPQGEGGGGDFPKLVAGINTGLMVMGELLTKGGAPPELVGELQDLQARYQGFAKKVMGAGGPPQQQQGAPRGPMSMEGGPDGVHVG